MWVKFLFFILLWENVYTQVSQTAVRAGIQTFVKNGTFTDDFREYLRSFNMKHALRTNPPDSVRADVTCILCNVFVEEILVLYRIGLIPDNLFAELVIAFCVDLELESPPICRGVIEIHAPTFFFILNNRPTLHAETFCGLYLQGNGCEGYFDDWSVDIPPGNTLDTPKGEISDLLPINILHVSDIHYDPLYGPGSNAVCGDPLCCQVDGPPPARPEDAAGYWGDYRDCDAPFHLVEEAIDHINENHPDIDYLYFTGDVIQHLVWGTTRQTNIRDNELIYRTLNDGFPNIPVFPILGNHEPHPVNLGFSISFSPSSVTDDLVTTQWLFDQVAQIWGDWLGDETRESIRRGGYYSVVIRPGFRVVALNSNVGYVSNFWLLYDHVDPFGQLQWLSDTLLEAENNGEFVHLLSHIPSTGNSMFKIWSREYRRILERFANTITAAFNGHSHHDQWIVYHNSSNPTQPINIAWNGGSLTPASNNNPNYKIYTVDAESYEVLDFDTWTYNLTAANLSPEVRPTWFKLYSLKEAYGMEGATPSDIRLLAQRMVTDRSLVEQYARFYTREADTSLANGCDDGCLWWHICDILKSETGDYTQCEEILADW